jgi:hypothetical protein
MRRLLPPHFLHLVARTALRALQSIQIFLISILFSASGNLAIIFHLNDYDM